MVEYPPEVTRRFHGTPEQLHAGVVGEWPKPPGPIVLHPYDPAWPDRYAAVSAAIRAVLGDLVAGLEHVGSTSVPGLAAKPVIDIDLLIADTADESAYVPALTAAGYVLVLREPWWHGHRMLVSAAADVHLHVWPQDAPEPVRHKLFRDWLRTRPDDLRLYASVKYRLAGETAANPGDYSLAKNDVIDDIYARVFAA
ncbi:GrpB family protein [Dactylosporangium sp. NPDC005555]|uniref:GrpB family protein n=1 Tax=Dactylosporangium sp. NPDC005555 TaxID=3154889 RepID=UPI0033A3E676